MTDTPIIEAIRTYIATYSGLTEGAPLWVDYIGSNPVEFAIIPLPGEIILEENIDGSTENQFPFALQSVMNTADDSERMGNGEFFELFRDWLREQTLAGVFPVVSDIKLPYSIQAVNAGFIMEQGESSTAVYQITCNLLYAQKEGVL